MSIQLLHTLSAKRNKLSILQRLKWLEDRLFWHGQVRRTDLIQRFDISPQQASADIAEYQSITQFSIRYDNREKVFLPEKTFKPVFEKDALEWIRQQPIGEAPSPIPFEEVPHPARVSDDQIIKAILASYDSRRPLWITYQSLSSSLPKSRVICPHHIVTTSSRMHVRAWDDESREFRDFVLSRITSPAEERKVPWVDERADTAWSNFVEVRLVPHPRLSRTQQIVAEAEYGMKKGLLSATVREALLIYYLDQLGLLDAVRKHSGVPGHDKWVACENAGDLLQYLPAVSDNP